MAPIYANALPAGTKNHIENVAIVGATGQIGTHVVKALLAEGKHSVTAITRADSTAAIPAGVAVKRVDYADTASLAAALAGQDALIITMAVTAPPDSSTKLIEAAAAAGVPWVVPNEWGGDVSNSALHTDVPIWAAYHTHRELIKARGMSFVGVSCGFWYEYSLSAHPYLYGFDIPGRKVTLYDDGATPQCTSTKPFAGLAAARLLALPIHRADAADKRPCLDDFRDGSAYVASFRVTQRDMLAAVQRATGTSDADWTIEKEDVRQRFADGQAELAAGNRLGFGKLLYARLFFPDGSADFETKYGLSHDALGLKRADEDFDAWTREAVDLANKPSFFREH